MVVVAAGTSDLPVAREALLTAQYLGRRAELVVDVGVAGLHRILSRASCFAKLGSSWSQPGWTCPAQRGRRTGRCAGRGCADLGRLRRLLRWHRGVARHAQCLRSGVAVVNIDNGYGAGHLAAQIAAPAADSAT